MRADNLADDELWSAHEKAKADLGSSFDLKQFHNAVLKNGALPLSYLDGQVKAWVHRRQIGAAA